MITTPYKVLLSYQGTELLAYPTDPIAFAMFAVFVGFALLTNLVLWAYSDESFLGAIGYMVLFAFVTTLFTTLAIGGCIKSGCHLANVMTLALPWGWLFGAIAVVGAVLAGITKLFR